MASDICHVNFKSQRLTFGDQWGHVGDVVQLLLDTASRTPQSLEDAIVAEALAHIVGEYEPATITVPVKGVVTNKGGVHLVSDFANLKSGETILSKLNIKIEGHPFVVENNRRRASIIPKRQYKCPFKTKL